VRPAQLSDFVGHCRVASQRGAEAFPIRAIAARDNVVDGRQRIFLMIEVSVNHGPSNLML
jgi:hypothetical protein